MPTIASERRSIYKQRMENGCCPRCGAKVKKSSGFKYCDDCRAFFRSYNERVSESLNEARKARYDERKENNQCPRCGKKLGKRYAKTICPECLEKQYNYNYGSKKPKKAAKKPAKVSKASPKSKKPAKAAAKPKTKAKAKPAVKAKAKASPKKPVAKKAVSKKKA